MAQSGAHAAAAHARIVALREAVRAAGYQVAAPRPIDYGEQLVVTDGAATITINVYGGKGGVRVVTGGAKTSPLFAAVSTLVDPQPFSAMPASGSRIPARRPADAFPPPPWIGSDESGKGDYFGPLVAAAVFVESEQEPALRRAGVQDSKLLDDASAHRVALEVRRLCAGRFAEELLPPEQYNSEYALFRESGLNLNHLLACGHVRVISALLAAGAEQSSRAPSVIADKFADERLVREELREELSRQGQPMPVLLQTPRAEANVAVAAASILARDRFLCWLSEASDRLGVALPKGGSKPSIIAAARRIVGLYGYDALGKVAKLHFATTKQVGSF